MSEVTNNKMCNSFTSGSRVELFIMNKGLEFIVCGSGSVLLGGGLDQTNRNDID